METYLAGMGVGLSLIVAIGAQNAYVLRQGMRRDRILTVVLICIASDALLITVGTAGLGSLLDGHERVLAVVTWLGAAYLLWFAVRSFKAARSPGALQVDGGETRRGSVAGTTLAITYLNPHVYLDTVVMLGGIAARYGAARWTFATGAFSASLLWFVGLAAGAAALAGPLASSRTWRWIDLSVGVIVLLVAARLVSQALG